METYDIWLIVIGSLVSSSCGLLGCFLILRKLSLMGDAISHAVLPGIVIAVVLAGKLHPIAVFLGAATMGLLTPLLVDLLHSSKLIQEDASVGAVFTFLFSIGVILVSNIGNIDLDTECVLYGEIANAPNITIEIFDIIIPKAFLSLSLIFLCNLAFVYLLYKELKITTFDTKLASSLGFSPRLLHYLLMAMVSITTVASFDHVGAIIVVAMFIVPGATAYLLTHRLGMMLLLSVILGIVGTLGGWLLCLAFGQKASMSGCISVSSGFIFGMVFLFSPKNSILYRKRILKAQPSR